MESSSNFSLENLLKTTSSEDVTRALQVNLGYSVDTHIPTIDEFLEDDYYLGKMTGNGTLVYEYWRRVLRHIFPTPLYSRYDTVFLRSAID